MQSVQQFGLAIQSTLCLLAFCGVNVFYLTRLAMLNNLVENLWKTDLQQFVFKPATN